MAEMIVLGGGGHGKVVIGLAKKAGYRVLGYVDPQDHGPVLGAPRLGDDTDLDQLGRRHPGCRAALGVGRIEASSLLAMRMLAQLEGLGFVVPVLISPQASVNEEVRLGAGTVVFDGVVINSGAVVGRACILNTNCTVEHDCQLDDNVHVAPGATLSGGVILGAGCMVGVGACLVQGVRVAAGCMIGAGTVVVRDLERAGTYVGNPARKIG